MQKENFNKAMRSELVSNKKIETKDGPLMSFWFEQDGDHPACYIDAHSLEEAKKIYNQK